MKENREKQTQNRPGLFEISSSACNAIRQEYGVSMLDIGGPMRCYYKARILFAGILAAFEVPAGTIARLLHKTTESVEGYIEEYNRRLSTSTEFQQITKKVKDCLAGG